MQHENAETALTRKTTIHELVSAYENACAAVRTAFGLLVEAERRLNAVYTLGSYHTIHISAGGNYRERFDDVDACIGRLRREAWRVIVDRLELQRMMSIGRWNELEKDLERGTLPEITEGNVASFAEGYRDALPQMLTEAVAEVFEWLRPHGQYAEPKYKRNSELEVPSKIILERMVEREWRAKDFRLHYAREQRVTALENVFSALDGQGQINKAHRSVLGAAIATSPDGHTETAYFRVKCFKNGNLHLEFLRPDLLARFNQIAGGARLRPAA